jgi:hypothetical protein
LKTVCVQFGFDQALCGIHVRAAHFSCEIGDLKSDLLIAIELRREFLRQFVRGFCGRVIRAARNHGKECK